MTRGPAKPISARGSAMMTSPSIAKLAVTPPVVGSVRIEMYGSPAAASRSSAADVLAICISERMPSCIRAPPEAETLRTGRCLSMASPPAALHLSPVDDLLARVALDPQAFGDDDLAAARLLFALEPGHRDLPPRLDGRRREWLAQRRLELGDELAHVVDEGGRAGARLDEANDRRAYGRAVGDASHRRHLRGRADPEADAHRHRRLAADGRDLRR